MNRFWPPWIESLPLDGADFDDESRTYHIEFREGKFGTVRAIVFNDEDIIIDVVHGGSFTDAYDNVRRFYPQAYWNSEEE